MGSLIATWLTQHTSASLILLGRSGRLAKDSALTAASFANACVTISRNNVAAVEEAAHMLESARLHSQPLQACTPPSFLNQNRRSMGSLVIWAPICVSE